MNVAAMASAFVVHDSLLWSQPRDRLLQVGYPKVAQRAVRRCDPGIAGQAFQTTGDLDDGFAVGEAARSENRHFPGLATVQSERLMNPPKGQEP